jgi:thioredoxin 2
MAAMGEYTMASAQELSVESFDREVLEQEAPVVVDFWSQTCPHCLHLGPHFDKAAEARQGQVKFAKIAVQADAMAVFNRYHVSGVPTMILFRGGQEVARQSGAKTCEEILAWLQQCL